MNLTQSAKQVLSDARDTARGRGHAVVEPNHIALALLSRESPATLILDNQRVDRERVRTQVNLALAMKTTTTADHLTVEQLLSGAAAQSAALGHAWVGTEHILLAFFDDAPGAMATAMTREGLTMERASVELQWMLGPDPVRPPTLGPGR